MNLCDVQAKLRDTNPYYVNMLTWTQHNGIIKATPKKPLSNLAYKTVEKVFKRLGGKPVSWRGQSWFELVLLEKNQAYSGSQQDPEPEPSLKNLSGPDAVLKQIGCQIASLCRAARLCLKETRT